jgi:hypothetical protein
LLNRGICHFGFPRQRSKASRLRRSREQQER